MLVAVPLSRPEQAAHVRQTLERQEAEFDVVIVENGRAVGSYVPRLCEAVIRSESSAGAARNAALEYARWCRQDWVIFLDDDDYYGPQYVSSMLEHARNSRADALHQGMGFVRFGAELLYFLPRARYQHVHGNSLSVHISAELPRFPEVSGGEEVAWTSELRRRGLSDEVVPPWHHVYYRTGTNSWQATRTQILASYGSARNLGGLPDEAADAPIDESAYPLELAPDDDAVFRDLEQIAVRTRFPCLH